MPRECFVIRDKDDALAGVGVIYYTLESAAPTGLPVDIRVLAGQSCEVSVTSFRFALERAAMAGASQICSTRWFDPGERSSRTQAWRDVGASTVEGSVVYRARLDDIVSAVRPLTEAIHRRQRAAGVVLRDLKDVVPEPLIAMHRRCFGGREEVARQRLDASGVAGYLPVHSVVACRGEQPIGVILIRTSSDPRTVIVDSICVAEDARGGVADVLLMHESARRALEGGMTFVEFAAAGVHQSTRKFAIRSGAAVTAVTARYWLDNDRLASALGG